MKRLLEDLAQKTAPSAIACGNLIVEYFAWQRSPMAGIGALLCRAALPRHEMQAPMMRLPSWVLPALEQIRRLSLPGSAMKAGGAG